MPTALGRHDLVLCAGTVLGTGLLERMEVAATAGCAGIGVRPSDLRRAREEGVGLEEIRSRLDDHGLVVAEIDTVTQWLPHHRAGPVEFTADQLWDAVARLGVRGVNVAEMGTEPRPLAEYAEGFARLCDRAAETDTLVHLEPLPWSALPDMTAVSEVVRRAARPNGGVLVDTWHHFRAREDDSRLASIPVPVLGLQVSDAPREPSAGLTEETQHHRLLPGHGDGEVAHALASLWSAGVDVPVGVEVMSDVLAMLPPATAAARAAGATRTVLAEADQLTSTATGNLPR